MSFLTALIASFRNDEEGQGLAEYALILALIAIVAIIALIFLGTPGQHDPVEGRQPRSRPPIARSNDGPPVTRQGAGGPDVSASDRRSHGLDATRVRRARGVNTNRRRPLDE